MTKEKNIKKGGKIEKDNYSLKLYKRFAEEFDSFWPHVAGGKGEHVSVALMGYMALHRIDEGLAAALADPGLTPRSAEKLILERMDEVILRRTLLELTPEERARILQDAKRSRQRQGRKK